MKKAIAAAALVISMISGLLVTTSNASAQAGCVLGIFIAAAQVGQREHRELTSEEAWSCGLTAMFKKPEEAPKKVSHHKSKKPQQ